MSPDADSMEIRNAGPSDTDDGVTAEFLHQEMAALLRAWEDRGVSRARGVAALLGFAQRGMAHSGITCAELAGALQHSYRGIGKDASLVFEEEKAFLRDVAIADLESADWAECRRAVVARLLGDPDAYEDPRPPAQG